MRFILKSRELKKDCMASSRQTLQGVSFKYFMEAFL